MDIRFAGKNISVTEGMKTHLQEKLVKFEKYAPRLIESHVVLKKEKYLFVAEITLRAKNLRAYGEGSAKENIFAAIDLAYAKVEKQLKKFREKVKDHNKHGNHFEPALKTLTRNAAAAQSLSAGRTRKETARQDESLRNSPRIVKSRDFEAKPMSIDEASMQLAIAEKEFIVFQNSSTQKVNVLFKREDGNHGLIEPNF